MEVVPDAPFTAPFPQRPGMASGTDHGRQVGHRLHRANAASWSLVVRFVNAAAPVGLPSHEQHRRVLAMTLFGRAMW